MKQSNLQHEEQGNPVFHVEAHGRASTDLENLHRPRNLKVTSKVWEFKGVDGGGGRWELKLFL